MIAQLNLGVSAKYPYSKKGFKPEKISRDNFNEIKGKEKDLVFIDGGNAQIIETPSYCLSLIRTFSCSYRNNKRIHSKRKQYIAEIFPKNINGKLAYSAKINGETFKIDFEDKNLMEGSHYVSISKAVNVLRRIFEIKEMSGHDGSVVILDGSLEPQCEADKIELMKLFEKGLDIAGFCKSSGLLADNGLPLGYEILRIAPDKTWYYYPAYSGNFDICMAKLHENSSHIFRVDVFGKKDVFYSLSQNAMDPLFLGYPYCLIVADRFARVSNEEREYLKIRYESILQKQGISALSRFVDSHEILDNIT